MGSQHYLLDHRLASANVPSVLIRGAFLHQNYLYDEPLIREKSVIARPLHGLPVPHVDSRDVAECAVRILTARAP